MLEGAYVLDDVFAADEVMALSTVKEISPVAQVDDHEFAAGPITKRLTEGFAELVAEELG